MNANATDVAAVAEDALVVLVMVWRWIIVPLGWLLVLVLTPWVLARSGTPASPAGMAPTERSAGMRPVARPDRRTVYWASALAAFLAIAVYVDSLGNGLVLDDESVIVENQAVRHPLDWRTILLTSSWFSDVAPSIAYRPLTTWTFALDHALHAERPFGYHLVNVLGHAAVTALVVALAASLGLSPPAAGLAGALFAVHPIHTEVVANGVGRAEILAAGLALVALLAWRRAATGRQSLLGAAAIATAYALALLAKEHAIALIVLLPLADLLFIDGGSPSLYLRRLRGRRALLYLALATLTIGYLALRAVALGGVVGAGGSGVSRWPFWLNPTASAPAGLRIATALKVQALALWLLLVPFHLSADYYYDQIPVVASLSEPGAIAGLLVAMLLAALAVVLWRRRLAFFWLMLALLTYGVVSNIPFPIGTIFGERLLYLPSVRSGRRMGGTHGSTQPGVARQPEPCGGHGRQRTEQRSRASFSRDHLFPARSRRGGNRGIESRDQHLPGVRGRTIQRRCDLHVASTAPGSPDPVLPGYGHSAPAFRLLDRQRRHPQWRGRLHGRPRRGRAGDRDPARSPEWPRDEGLRAPGSSAARRGACVLPEGAPASPRAA